MSESKTQTEDANDTVEVRPEVLNSLLKAAQDRNNLGSDYPWGDTEETEAAIEQAQEILNNQTEDDKEFQYLTDEQDETYGYAVYNTHENCFVPLPADLSNIRSPVTAHHLTSDRSESILHAVAYDHQLDKTDHLRVVRVTLDNELDHKAIEYLEDKKQEV